MNNLIYLGIVTEDVQRSDVQCIAFCADALRDKNVDFPTDMQPGERRLLIQSDELRITLYHDYQGNYQFIYNSIAAGRGTQFPSALFKLDRFLNYAIVAPEKAAPSDVQCIQICMDELSNFGYHFPRNMHAGEVRTLLKNDDMKVVLRQHYNGDYQFFYHSIANGSETPFSSACFKVERF